MIAPQKTLISGVRRRRRLPNRKQLMCLALLSICVVIVIALSARRRDVQRNDDTRIKKPDWIPAVQPAVKKVVLSVVTNVTEEFCYGKNGKVQKDNDGNKWFNGARVFDEGPGDAFLDGKKIKDPPPFLFRSERMIADLIRHPVGLPMPAAPNYAVNWDDDFVKSLMHHIVIEPTDSEEIKQLKRDVIAAKKEIVKIIRQGGTFSDVIQESQKEANRLAGIRTEMQRIYVEMKKDGASPQELKDHLDAANILLSRKGAIPLPISGKLLLELEDD